MMLQSRRYWLFGAVLLGLIAYLTAAFWDYTQDDVFITYAYSRNIAEGRGFVFNPGERVQGTTTPLYTLLMSGVYFLTHDLLHAGNLLSAVLLALTCGLAFLLTRDHLSHYSGFAIGVILATSPLIYVSFGMETLLYCTLLMLALWRWERGKPYEAILVAAALTWTRADGVVLGGTLWLVAAWDSWRANQDVPIISRLRQLPYPLGLVYTAAIAPWYLFAWAYFDTPLPNTFGAKQSSLEGIQFLKDGWNWWKIFYWDNNPLSITGFLFVVIGVWRILKIKPLRPVALWAGFYLAGYTILNVAAFWYYTPLFTSCIVLMVFGGAWIFEQMGRLNSSKLWRFALAGILVGVSGVFAIVRSQDFADPPPRTKTYVVLGKWIEANTLTHATLLVGDLGVMGYYAQRHTIDSPGLIVPEMYFKQDDYAVLKYKPDYVVATGYYTWQQVIAQDWFDTYYRPAAQFSTEGDTFSPMTVYQRRLPLRTPPILLQGDTLPFNCDIRLNEGDALPDEISARLLDSGGNIIVEDAHPFFESLYPVDTARGNEVIHEQIGLPLYVPAGNYQWELVCGDDDYSGNVEVLPYTENVGLARLEEAVWSPFAQLAGIALTDGNVAWSGGSVRVVFYWQALEPATADYSALVHLVDAQGHVVAQADGYAVNNTRPLSSWQSGEMIFDTREILLPPNLPAGNYSILVGWYDWQSGSNERQLLTNGDDAIRLPVTIQVQWPGGTGLP